MHHVVEIILENNLSFLSQSTNQ